MSDVDKITKEMSSIRHFKAGKGCLKGYKGIVDLGYTLGAGGNSLDRIELMTTHGYQFSPYFYAGLGAGAHYYTDAELLSVPIFANIRASLLDNKITPFFDFKIGYSVLDIEGFYLSPSIGCRFAINQKSAINVSLGYSVQKTEIYWYNYRENVKLGGVSLKFGFDF